jgi:hypothetical protein
MDIWIRSNRMLDNGNNFDEQVFCVAELAL